MSRAAARDLIIGRGHLAAAGIAGDGALDAGGVLEHALHAPEAAAGDDGSLQAVGARGVGRGRWDFHRVLGGARRHDGEGGDRQRADGGGTEGEAEGVAAHVVSSCCLELAAVYRMIRKSVQRFSGKIMRKQRGRRDGGFTIAFALSTPEDTAVLPDCYNATDTTA